MFFIPFVFSFLLNLILARLAYKYKFLDVPFERKSHLFPVALGGGVALFLSLAVSSMFLGIFHDLLFFASLLVFMGLIDDLFDLPPILKLSFQVGVSVLWLVYSPCKLFGNAVLDFVIGVFWLVFLTNAFNIIDGIDGLASGIAILTSIGLIFKGAVEAYLLLGACLGFFVLNYPPAKIFLGDAGAYLLGFLIGVLSLYMSGTQPFSISLIFSLFFILFFPLVETTWTVLRRYFKGQSPIKGDDKHIHHCLKMSVGGKTALFILLLIHGVSVLVGVWCF
ncbi:MAG: undecaprenyl/decaprenyl-phosphate alpha-N-acetylglucosaminyl 1-phosphate transferase [Synergistetes bacterium]|nr:undecaprenyl/decaprenyl-phosphate alpha-N-acetylglucosaminyl 1-phosphate transferase [Synergistota bacterium]